MSTSGPRIGLALGGGSARGLAHVLMLEAFDELGVKPAVIAGTSMGRAFAQSYAAPNSQPNPYRTVEHWAKLGEGRTLGSTSAVDIAPDGSVWVAERCGANTCAGSNLAPVLKFDPSGKLLTSIKSSKPAKVCVQSTTKPWIRSVARTITRDNAAVRRPIQARSTGIMKASRATIASSELMTIASELCGPYVASGRSTCTGWSPVSKSTRPSSVRRRPDHTGMRTISAPPSGKKVERGRSMSPVRSSVSSSRRRAYAPAMRDGREPQCAGELPS